MRSEALKQMIQALEQGLAQQEKSVKAPGAAAALKASKDAIEELKHKLTLAETVTKFYGELPMGRRLMVDAVLPPELKALLTKGPTT